MSDAVKVSGICCGFQFESPDLLKVHWLLLRCLRIRSILASPHHCLRRMIGPGDLCFQLRMGSGALASRLPEPPGWRYVGFTRSCSNSHFGLILPVSISAAPCKPDKVETARSLTESSEMRRRSSSRHRCPASKHFGICSRPPSPHLFPAAIHMLPTGLFH